MALLVATSVYSDPELRELRAPGRDAAEFAEVLRDSRVGGFDVQVLVDAASGEVQERIEDFCEDRHPSDQLLIYLSCHGVLDSHGRLYYAAANTWRQRLAATAIASAWLNERLDDCRARSQILVLDCCHSGAFARGAKGDTELALKQRFEPHGRGRVVLTASRGTEYSFEGDQVSGDGVPSVFTHAIVNGLRTGDADRDKDGLISVADLYQYLYHKVRAAEPRQTPELWTYGAEGSLLVARSIRGAVIEPAPLPEDLRATLESPRLAVREAGVMELAPLLGAASPALALAARLALEQVADEDRPQVAELARRALDASPPAAADRVRREVTGRARREEQPGHEAQGHTTQPAHKDHAAVPVRTDPDRAARLIADAERIAQSLPDDESKAQLLGKIAQALAATDPDRAERIVRSITVRTDPHFGDDLMKAMQFAHLAQALAAAHPDRTERIVLSITYQDKRDSNVMYYCLIPVAEALAATDPDRAERIAQYYTSNENLADSTRAGFLAEVAEALAATDSDRAERIAQSIPSEFSGMMRLKAGSLAKVAAALAATDPDRAARLAADAERIAQSITIEQEFDKAVALANVAAAVAATDPDRAARLIADAERIAQSTTEGSIKACALTNVAAAVAVTDPDRAARLAADAERIAQSITNEYTKDETLAVAAEVLAAATDSDRAARLVACAERIAQSISDEDKKVKALFQVAEALAATDPGRAERIAQSITDEYTKARTLVEVARALAATDPGRAERIAQSITDEFWKTKALVDVAEVLTETGRDRAAWLMADAERIAQSITDEFWKVKALAAVAEALAPPPRTAPNASPSASPTGSGGSRLPVW